MIGAARVIRARPPRTGAVQTFERLLAVAAPVEATPVTRSRMMTALSPERVFALVMLAVVIIFLLARPLGTDTGLAPQTPAGQAFADALKADPAGKPVLLVYDWDASRYGEMYPLSQAVTRLLVQNKRPFVTISTQPEGSGFALNVTASVVPTSTTSIDCGGRLGTRGSYGTTYLHLGYLPGNEAGLAGLASGGLRQVARFDAVCYRDAANTSILSGVDKPGDFGAIVLLAGEEGPLRLWIEQVGSGLMGGKTPLLAAVPEAARPAALPYAGTGNAGSATAMLRGVVYGMAGAQELDKRAGAAANPDRLGTRIHAESAALLTLAAALLLAFISGAYRWINRRSGA
jgi:hypothetical protein